MRNRFGAVK